MTRRPYEPTRSRAQRLADCPNLLRCQDGQRLIEGKGVRLLERFENFEGGMPRAARFAIEVPIRYRAVGEPEWRSGQSANISRSGVLFRGEEILLPETRVELILRLPLMLLGEPGAEVVCAGEVVRTVATTGQPATLAATIAQFRFERGVAER